MEYKVGDIEQPLLVKKEEDTPAVSCWGGLVKTEAELQEAIDVWVYNFTKQLLQTRWLWWWHWRTVSFQPDPSSWTFNHAELEPRIRAYFIKSIRLAFKPRQHLLKSLQQKVSCSKDEVSLGLIVYLADDTWSGACLSSPMKWLLQKGTPDE